jgi:PAS domain S-box-containing protein
MLKAARAHADTAGLVANLADEMLTGAPASPEIAAQALDRLRRGVLSTEAALWFITGARAERVLTAGNDGVSIARVVLELGAHDVTAARLRPHATIVCGRGDVSGMERLVPAGVSSFVAATTRRDSVLGVLLVGWAEQTAPCDRADAAHFRIAATLLVNGLVSAAADGEGRNLPDTILGSLSGRIAVIDRDGTIIAVNAAWTEFGRSHGATSTAIGLGVSYVEICRRAASALPDADAALEGIQSVCTGVSDGFESVYPFSEHGEERWCLMTVTPLRRPEGGAVIAHADVTRPRLIELAQRISEGRFQRLADTIPVPVWMVAPDGRLLYGNHLWMQASGERTAHPSDLADWTAAVHPEDRRRAKEAFQSAVSRRSGLSVELRLRALDGAYRWYSCIGAPRFGPDGQLENHLGVCFDISEKRRAESALGEVAAKLVAAQEEERGRVARELHDDLGQQVTLLLSQLDTLARARPASLNRMRTGLAAARRSLQDIASSVHSLSHRLHPAKLRLLGLVPTLDALCRDVSKESGVQVKFQADRIPDHIGEATALGIFRVAQEALQNAVKHSGARTVDVRLTGTPQQLTLRVADTGKGFELLATPSAGLGLLTMRERVELSGGSLRIDTADAQGTTIEATLPLPA